MKKTLALTIALICVLLLICGCTGNRIDETDDVQKETPTEEVHVHDFRLAPTEYDWKNTEYYEGGKPFLDGLKLSLVCDCGESMTAAGEIVCTDEEYTRNDTEMHITCGEYSCILPINVTPVRRIAFVGDSLTQGAYGIAYTVFVKKALKHNVTIGNFGVSGISATGYGGSWDDSDYKYIKQSAFSELVEFQPELILVMLGTNDAFGWERAKDVFEADYEELLTALTETGAKIVVMTTIPVADENAFGIDDRIISDEIVPIEKAVAERVGADVYDTYAIVKENTPEKFYLDGIHQTDSGKEYFAGIVTDKICEIYGYER